MRADEATAGVRLHDPLAFRGSVEMHRVESQVLQGNALGDPHVRELPLYLPPGAREGGGPYPVLFVLAGFTGRGQGYLETHPWRRGLVSRFDQAVAEGEAPPAILALPDCFTFLGGSQYVNSPAVGRYQDHVLQELVPLVEERCPAIPGRRGVLGKSSGGFGALHLALEAPGVFAGCGSISGDCGFEAMFAGELYAAARGLIPYGGSMKTFLESFLAEPRLFGDAHAVVNVLAMAACYSPNPEAELGFDLPFDPGTGERIPEVWKRWLAFDPLERVEAGADALRALDFLHVECGVADEYHIQWGTRRMVRRLRELGVEHTAEEHAGGHRDIDHRYAPLLWRMASVLGAA